MAAEFSRRPLLSLLLCLRLSIFNLNCSCHWLEGQQGGMLLAACAVQLPSYTAPLLQCRDSSFYSSASLPFS